MSAVLKTEYDVLKAEVDTLVADLNTFNDMVAKFRFIAEYLIKGEIPQVREIVDPDTGAIIESNADLVQAYVDRKTQLAGFFSAIGLTKDKALELLMQDNRILEDKAKSLLQNARVLVKSKLKELEAKKQEVIDAVLLEQNIVF